MCLPGVKKSRVLGEVPVVKVHITTTKITSIKLLSTILVIILGRRVLLCISCGNALIHPILMCTMASDCAGALGSHPSCLQRVALHSLFNPYSGNSDETWILPSKKRRQKKKQLNKWSKREQKNKVALRRCEPRQCFHYYVLTTSSPGASVFDLSRIPPLPPPSSSSNFSLFVAQKKISSSTAITNQVG